MRRCNTIHVSQVPLDEQVVVDAPASRRNSCAYSMSSFDTLISIDHIVESPSEAVGKGKKLNFFNKLKQGLSPFSSKNSVKPHAQTTDWGEQERVKMDDVEAVRATSPASMPIRLAFVMCSET
jgi:hypothetical protein